LKNGPVGMESWEKLFLFASYCRTWSEEEESDKWYPIAEPGWEYLREMQYYMLTEPFLVILKVRQILATWSLAVRYVWMSMANEHRSCGFASKGIDEGKEFLRRCEYVYTRLPEAWKRTCPARRIRGELVVGRELRFHNGSRIKTYSSKGEGPRSDVLSCGAIDEANYLSECKAMIKSYRPALGKDRPLVVLSTPKLVESDFEEVVDDAETGTRGKLLKFPVTCRPGRDKAWQNEMEEELGEDGYATEYGLQFAIRESHALFPRFSVNSHVVEDDFFEELLKDADARLYLGQGVRAKACPVFCALDTHVTKPSAALWMAVLPDDTWYIIDELWERCDAEQFARLIQVRERDYRVVDRVIDPSANMEHKTGGMKPVSTQLREAGLSMLRTARRHKIGIDHLQAKMEAGANNRFAFYVNPRCKMTIKQLRSAGLASEQKAQKGGKYDFLDCAKYIANCRPQYRVWKYQEEHKKQQTAYSRMLQELDENIEQARMGYHRGAGSCQRTLH